MFTRFIIPAVCAVFALAACAPIQVPPTAPPGEALPMPALTPTASANQNATPPAAELTPPEVAPYAPQPADSGWVTGTVFLEAADMLTLESYPPQYVLQIKGSLPTPCHQLRVVVGDLVKGQRAVQVYSVTAPDQMCIQVLQPFEANVPLGSATAAFAVVINNAITVPAP